MDIRTRLHVSNIVMIVVPVTIAMVVGLACVAVVWGIVSAWVPIRPEQLLGRLLGMTDISASTEGFLKSIVAVVALVLLAAVVLSVFFTDRFLTKFVLVHVTRPLDQLSAGVEQIRAGNLAYRIDYQEHDEFRPVCDAFDEMALRLKQSVENDRRGEQARKQLIAGMSHDLRSPLTSIRGYAEGLRDGVASSEDAKARYLDVILDKTSVIEYRLSQLLTMTKLDMDEYPLEMRAVWLDRFVTAFLQRKEGQLYEQGMDVTACVDHVAALADTGELERILTNVRENSLRYRERERVAVCVNVRDTSDAAELSVEDDGPGVPDESLERIFDVLYREDTARSELREGSGLGLAIVAASAGRMHGTVHAERSPQGGLSVIVRLPRASSDEAGQEETSSS